MAALCDVRDSVDVWLDDPDLLRAEFDALIAENFAWEPPGAERRATPPPEPSRRGREPRWTPRYRTGTTAAAGLRAARERGPPGAG